jgi:hypothetical protein
MLALASVLVGVQSAGAAPRVTVTAVEQSRPGWFRIVARYEATGRPAFRITPTCGAGRGERWVVGALVRVVPRPRRAIVDVRDDLGWLAEWTTRCGPVGLALEMVQDGKVVAVAPLPLDPPVPVVELPPAPPAGDEPARLAFTKRKFGTPDAQTSEAGVSVAVSPRVAVQLGYARTALGRSVPHDVDNGVRTSVRLGF